VGGMFGDLIGNGIKALPGGSDAPDGDGWCLSIEPNSARVARLQEGVSPLAVMYFPDFQLNAGVITGASGYCHEWLTASLAVEAGFVVKNGTELAFDLNVREGAVLLYGSESDWEEAEVVEGLGSFLEASMGLLGSQFSFDLADLMGGGSSDDLFGAFGEMSIEIIDSEPLFDESGQHPEGLYAISVTLWE
jgi:hypothetical protein